MNPLIFQSISVDEIVLNEYETAKRLNVEKGYTSAEIEMCLARLKQTASCKFSAVRVPVSITENRIINCGFGEFKSTVLAKNLGDCREAFVFASTIGIGVDRLLNKLSALSAAEFFITDALASSMAEAVMNEAEKRVKGDMPCRPRFSPGFGDFGLEHQSKILDLVNAGRLLGITINKAFLMSPMKSVTAIMGIKPNSLER